MRELVVTEVQHISGGNVFGDLKVVAQQGLSDPMKTFTVAMVSTGLFAGGLMAKVAGAWGGPLCAIALSAGWYFYDKNFPNGALADLATTAP
jgi:hypothetical protein